MNFNQKWINLLTEGGRAEKQREFAEILVDAPSETLAIMKYRRLQMNEGRGQDIPLRNANSLSEEVLQELLQEIFLEPITIGHIEYFYRKASEKYNDMNEAMQELYDRHLQDKGLRFLTVVLTI